MSYRPLVALAVLLVLAAAGCVSQQKVVGQETTGLDRKLSTFAWIENGDLVTLIVGTRPARYREAAPYLPLEISIGNRGVKYLTLSRESFTLVDAQGNRYPCAGPKELLEGYEFLDLDREPSLAELAGLVSDRFAAFTRYPASFSPTRTAVTGTVRDRMSLPRFGWFVDFIYFPHPPGGVVGQRFDLFVDAPELEDPVFVKFEIR